MASRQRMGYLTATIIVRSKLTIPRKTPIVFRITRRGYSCTILGGSLEGTKFLLGVRIADEVIEEVDAWR